MLTSIFPTNTITSVVLKLSLISLTVCLLATVGGLIHYINHFIVVELIGRQDQTS